MDRERILQKLKASLEVSTIKNRILTELILLPLICIFHCLTAGNSLSVISPLIFYSMVGLSALIPLLAIEAWRLWKIFRQAEFYRFYQVTLREVGHTWKHRSYYFILELEVPGGIRQVKTHPIFQTWGPINPKLKDYVNFPAVIAYNEATGEVVVIG